jgi:hypothetical protein
MNVPSDPSGGPTSTSAGSDAEVAAALRAMSLVDLADQGGPR